METIKINNNIKEDEVPLYNPQGKLIGIIKNELAFNDVRIQIYKNKLEGYYIIWKDRVYKFNKYGRLFDWPDDLYQTYMNQLDMLLWIEQKDIENKKKLTSL